MKKFFLIFVFFCSFSFPNDKTVAFVGNKPIFKSDVERRMEQENLNYSHALKKIIEEKLLLYGCEKKGIQVKKEEIEKEIAKMKSMYPDETAFLKQLEKEGLSLPEFRRKIIEKIKIRKFIKEEIVKRINIAPSEIARVMKEFQKSSYMFNFKFKWFDTEKEAEEFLKKEGKEKEMEDAGWMESNEIIHEILEILKKTEKGSFSPPVKIGKKYIVVLLIDLKKKKEENKIELYRKAKNYIYMEKFGIIYTQLIKDLENKIPVKILNE